MCLFSDNAQGFELTGRLSCAGLKSYQLLPWLMGIKLAQVGGSFQTSAPNSNAHPCDLGERLFQSSGGWGHWHSPRRRRDASFLNGPLVVKKLRATASLSSEGSITH